MCTKFELLKKIARNFVLSNWFLIVRFRYATFFQIYIWFLGGTVLNIEDFKWIRPILKNLGFLVIFQKISSSLNYNI